MRSSILILIALTSVLATIFVIGCHRKAKPPAGTQIIEKDGCKYWTVDDGYGRKRTYTDCLGKK